MHRGEDAAPRRQGTSPARLPARLVAANGESRGMDLWLLLSALALASAKSPFSPMKPASGESAIIQCQSPEMETFSCYWDTDDFPLEFQQGKIQLLFLRSNEKGGEWKDCPDYTTSGENSCYFNESFTSIWVPYAVRLCVGDQVYDEKHFRVEEIVVPDPPVALNWTVLNISPSGVYTDIEVTWKPPPSADVENGWLILAYQLQYKDVNATEWHKLDVKGGTEVPVYSLKTCKDYEIQIRSKGPPGAYGKFSDVLYVSFDSNELVPCEEDLQITWLLVMTFGILGLMVALSLVFFSKQQKLKILIFPPVPVPKIKGIDPDLLKQTGKQSCNMKKTSVVNLDKLLEDFSHIEMKISNLHGKNHLLNLELDKTNKLLTISQSREEMTKHDCATFQNVIKGLQQTVEDQYNLRDENEKLKNTIQTLEEKLKINEKEHENMVDKLIAEIKTKEKEHSHKQDKLHSDMNKQLESNMEEQKKLMERKDLEILELTKQLKDQEKEKQNEIIKLQIEFNTKLERMQTKTLNVQTNPTGLPQNIYRKKLQHLQEEKNKEIEFLRNIIKDLEEKLDIRKDCYFKLRKF